MLLQDSGGFWCSIQGKAGNTAVRVVEFKVNLIVTLPSIGISVLSISLPSKNKEFLDNLRF